MPLSLMSLSSIPACLVFYEALLYSMFAGKSEACFGVDRMSPWLVLHVLPDLQHASIALVGHCWRCMFTSRGMRKTLGMLEVTRKCRCK